MSFENIYDQDITKKKILYISSTTVTSNGNNLRLSSPSNSVGPISGGEQLTISIGFYPIDPYANDTGTTVSITDDDYTYSVSASIISKTFNGIMDGLTEELSVSNTWTSNNNTYNQYTYTISGTTSNILYSTYNIIARFTLTCTDKNGNLIRTDVTDESITFNTSINTDNSFYWDTAWLSSLPADTDRKGAYILFSGGLGSYIDVGVRVQNKTSQDIQYKIVAPGNDGSTGSFVPDGISILDGGVFGGSISLTSQIEKYYFSISGSVENNGQYSYGNPDTRSTVFCIDVQNYVSTEISQFNQINWETDSGSLGTVYEGYPSYFSVKASTSTGESVTYSLAPYSAALPSGITLDVYGNIVGILPYIDSLTSYYFTVRAQYGTYYSDRNFTITVEQLFGTSDFFNIHIPVFSDTKILLNYLTDEIDKDSIFRSEDNNFGITSNFLIYMCSGLKMTDDIIGFWDNTLTPTDKLYGVGQNRSVITKSNEDNFYSCIIDKLRNYHHPFEITISDIKTSPYYSIDGEYVCDVIYASVIDYHDFSGCFNSYGNEVVITYDMIENYEIDVMNIPYNNDGRIFVPSMSNCRNDLLLTTNRISSPTYMLRPNSNPGIGLVGKEGMPMWMMQTPKTNLGFTTGITIAYVIAGLGSGIVSDLKQTISYKNIIGKSWKVDRYVYETKNTSELQFIDTLNNVQEETVFDSGTTIFDVSYEPSYKYLFFPKLGDV